MVSSSILWRLKELSSLLYCFELHCAAHSQIDQTYKHPHHIFTSHMSHLTFQIWVELQYTFSSSELSWKPVVRLTLTDSPFQTDVSYCCSSLAEWKEALGNLHKVTSFGLLLNPSWVLHKEIHSPAALKQLKQIIHRLVQTTEGDVTICSHMASKKVINTCRHASNCYILDFLHRWTTCW